MLQSLQLWLPEQAVAGIGLHEQGSRLCVYARISNTRSAMLRNNAWHHQLQLIIKLKLPTQNVQLPTRLLPDGENATGRSD